MKLLSFKDSLNLASPGIDLSPMLKALWYDGKGNWDKAHAQVDHLGGKDAAWVHAYLHRKEGDLWNADYWYSKAGKSRPDIPLSEEWEILLQFFLSHHLEDQNSEIIV
ncbi:MAG: hypothetical protein RLZZ172_612 [Bacteroidota bacterium]|jgi:hypothetical protein